MAFSKVFQYIKDLKQKTKGREAKTGITLAIVFVQAALPCIVFGASARSSVGRACSLPWQVIAEKVPEGSWFCGSKDLPDSNTPRGISKGIAGIYLNCNYAYQPKQTITIKLPAGTVASTSSQKIYVHFAKWIESAWQEIDEVSASIEHNEMRVTGGIEKEGFFRLQSAPNAQDGQLSNFEAYAIVSDNWKRDILSFCRKQKEEIELSQDPQLIRHCIAVAHFDHTMEMVSQSSFLSGKILKALADAIWSRNEFDKGQCPDLVIGLNKIRFKRFEGAPVEEFVVFIPDSCQSSKAHPVFLHTDNSRWGARDNYSSRSGSIDVWWHTVSHKDLRWKDYRAFMKVIEQKLNVDKDRIYVDGECGNGIAAMALALNHPDQWAECSMSLGNSYRHLAGNALNLPLIFVKGGHNEDPLVGYYHFAVQCFQYHGSRHFKYSKTQNIKQTRGAPVPEAVRKRNPQRVLYTIESLRNPRAYWVTIIGREDENFPGTLDACVWGQTVLVKTENIDAYSLDLAQAPIDADRQVEIIENSRSLGLVKDKLFIRKSEKYVDASYIKNQHLHGPVCDAFTDPYVVVWGSGIEDKGFSKVSERIAKSLSKGGPCFVDVNMPEELANSHNLVLVGTAESNLWLSKICDDLPVRVEQGQIITQDKRYDGRDMGVILIYPNPFNPERYAVVFSGTSSLAMANISKAYSEMKSLRPADVGVFEITTRGSIKWHIMEKFNTVWDWHDKWDRILAKVDKKHPKWQWRQWIAKVIREQLETDVVVCEAPFVFKDSELAGQITYRKLFNVVRNDWIMKIRLDGNNLRKLLMVPFNDISKREVAAPVVDGISLVRNPLDAGEKVLAINELVDGAIYTVALPEKCINGQRMGLLLQDYQIVDQVYLVPILEDYLTRNVKADIDAQLDSLKFNIF